MSRRRATRGAGKALLVLGVLVGLFVGHQLWGTGLAERDGQRALAAQFQERQAAAGTAAADRPVALGDAVALIEIPSIDVEKWVGEGVGVEELRSGPGHYPGTPLPGRRGNAAIAGHRTTYGAPFYDLDALRPGDAIFVSTDEGRFRYDVTATVVVDPVEGGWVLDPSSDDRLTLTTCNPRFSAAERLIVTAQLMTPPTEGVAPPVSPSSAAVAGLDVGPSLAGRRASVVPALLWGGVAALVPLAAWGIARAWRRWPAYVLAAGPFLVALFQFYDKVARLLPADV